MVGRSELDVVVIVVVFGLFDEVCIKSVFLNRKFWI